MVLVMVMDMDMDMDMVSSGVHGVPELRAVSCAFVVTCSVFSVLWERRLYRNTIWNKLVEQFIV